MFWISSKNFQDISSYTEWLVSTDTLVDMNDKVEWMLTLNIGWSELTWNTINDILTQLETIESSNSNKNIDIEVKYNDQIQKNIQFKYRDFGYKINLIGVSNEIKRKLISGKNDIRLDLEKYIFFDEILLEKKLEEIQTAFENDERWEINFDHKKWEFSINSTESKLVLFKNRSEKIFSYKNDIAVEDSKVIFEYVTEDNVLFWEVENLNELSENLKNLAIEIDIDTFWINQTLTQESFDKIENNTIEIELSWKTPNLTFKKGFLLNYLTYDRNLNSLVLNEEKFNESYNWLQWFELINKDSSIDYFPSLFEIREWWITENFPRSKDFKILSYGHNQTFEFQKLVNSIKSLLSKVTQDIEFNEAYKLSNLWNKEEEFKTKQVEIENTNNFLVAKDTYSFLRWVYKKWDKLLEINHNFSDIELSLNKDMTWFNECEIEKKMMYCWSEYIWDVSIIRDWFLVSWISESYINWLEEIGTEFEVKDNSIKFKWNKIVYYVGWKISTLYIDFDHASYYDNKKELYFPNEIIDSISMDISETSMTFSYIWDESLLIKDSANLENYYFFQYVVSENK